MNILSFLLAIGILVFVALGAGAIFFGAMLVIGLFWKPFKNKNKPLSWGERYQAAKRKEQNDEIKTPG